jgi:hypothetical protein
MGFNFFVMNNKMKLSKPATIAAIAYLILGIIILMPLKIGEYDLKYEKTQKFDLGYRILLLLIMLIPIGLSLYSINCMVEGKCYIWSYINAIAVCIWVILFFVASLIASERI